MPSKLIKQQTEDAINNAIQGWKETQTMLLQGDAVISPQPEKKLYQQKNHHMKQQQVQ